MEEEEGKETTLTSLPIIRTELRVLTSRTSKLNNQLRGQKRFIISELGAQDNKLTEISEKNQVLQTKINALTRKNQQQEAQIASITSQVHLLTNQVDFLMARLRKQDQQEHQEQQEEQQAAQEEQVGNIVQE